MDKLVETEWHHNTFILSPLKCMYWAAEQALILSDVHFGKTNHFRKNGIAITNKVSDVDYANLKLAINQFNPTQIIIIGDLFHSTFNNEVIVFGQWILEFSAIKWILVKGNHDILSNEVFKKINLEVVNQLQIQSVFFIHEATKELLKQHPNLSFITGHVHPAIQLKLGVHQASFACFYFNNNQLILPAFGRFTGFHVLKPQKTSKVYCIVNDSIIAYQKP